MQTGDMRTDRQTGNRQAGNRHTGDRKKVERKTGDRETGDKKTKFTKKTIFCQKRSLNLSKIYQKFIDKKVVIDKISEDINVGESVLMNVAPLYFKKC
jgi:hypothetical protein